MPRPHPLLLAVLLLLTTALPLSADALPELLAKGQRQLEKEKYARAINTFREAQVLAPESQEVLTGLGQALYGRALALNHPMSRAKARSLLEELLETIDEPSQRLKAYNLLGTVIFYNHKLPEEERLNDAAMAYQQALGLSRGKDPSARLGLAVVLRDLGYFEEALDLLQHLSIDPLAERSRAVARGMLCDLKLQLGIPLENTTEPLHLEEGIQKPRRLYTPQPQYTDELRRAGISGQIVFRSIIDRDGCVSALEPINDDAPERLIPVAAEALRSWSFDPATRDGEPVEVYYHLTVNMRIH